uniref:Fibronectin type-III domain-containing protein n=1 Tax=Dermatophagoides pteronyssinus TaxID=6956 RepID=A0A6P6XN23_DERPT|nr:putative uncharacterized protein DDB_G0277255 [Dermatophagoides pteronyssinus]
MEKIIISNVSSSSSIRQTMINNLRSNSLYKIRLAAINRLGQSDYTKWLRFRTEQSAPETPPIDIQATPTGPNSIKITWKAPKKSEWNGEISGYYIGYRSEKSDTDLYKTVENVQVNGRYESHITNLQRSTIYKSWVQAFNQRGTGPRSEIVSVQTLADVPPSAPLLRLHSSTSDSITISWLSATFGGSGGSGGQLSSRKASSSSSSNDLTLYYRLYQPLSSSSSSSSVVTNNNNIGQQSMILMPNNWHDISIMEPNGRHTITGLECGRSYEFFATAHNSVGKSEPSTPLIARTRGEAPTPPGRNNLLSETISDNSKTVTIIINLINWKNNECPINHFTLRIRPLSLQKSSALQQQQQQQQQHSSSSSSSTLSATNIMSNTGWTILSMQHNPRENFLLRKLIPNQPYELEITAHSSAGSTQVIHQFITPNITANIDSSSSSSSFLNKIGYDNSNTKITSSISYPMPSSTTTEISFGDYEILLPIISSMIVVIVIIAVACFLCSRDHHSLFLQPIGNGHNGHNDGHHHHQRQPSTPSSENKVPFHHTHHPHSHHHHSNDPNDLQQQQEMSILKELVRSNSITIMDGFNPLINNGGGCIGQSTDSSTILTTTNGIIGGDYGDLQNRLIDSEPTSLINTNNNQQQQQQLRNHSYHHSHLHHHQLTLMSPRHQQQQGKTIAMGKDLVELQSFLNNSTNNNNNSNGYVTQKRIGHSGNGGNYALPYDVLPVVTQSKQQQSGNNMAIYGQRTTFISANNNNNNEPLYATAKLININGNGGGGQFVNYGPKIDELAMSTVIANSSSLSSSSTSSSTATTNGSQRTNYESLVPIICSSSSTSTSTSSSGMAISTASAVTAGTNTMVM